MEVNKPTQPDMLFKFVSVRPPKVSSPRPNSNPRVLSRILFNTATEAEIESYVTANGQFLFTQLENAYNANANDLAQLQVAFLALADTFHDSDFYWGNDSSNYYESLVKFPEFWDWYMRSDKTTSASEFAAKFEEITGVTISSIVNDTDFKERKLRLWDTLLYAVIKKDVPTEYQETVSYAVLTINTIEKVENSSADIDTPEKLALSMSRPVVYDEFIGSVMSYTERPDVIETNDTLESSLRAALYVRIGSLYKAISELEEFELREANKNQYYKTKDFNSDFDNGDFSVTEPMETTTQLERFYLMATLQTKQIMQELALESTNFSVSFSLKIIRAEIARAYSRFPATPQTAGISIVIGGNIISYKDGCYERKIPNNPCDAANEAVEPNKLNTGIFQSAGYGDLLIVEQNLLKYDLGEVAHIENILRGEKKTRQHTRLDRVEETQTTETETTKETERESQTTERFSIEKETSSVLQLDMGFEAGLKVTANYGAVQLESNLGFQLNSSTTNTSRTASDYAKDVTNRALDRVIERVRKLRTVTTIHEIKEFNEHILDNTLTPSAGGVNLPDHVSGVYRWVDKYYKCKIRNYGRRLMLEFIVPEPASFYIFAKANKPTEKMEKPVDPRLLDDPRYPVKRLTLGRKHLVNNPNALDELNVLEWAKIYNVPDITPLPDREIVISKSFNQTLDGDNDNDKVMAKKNDKFFPRVDKYEAHKAKVRVSMSVGFSLAANIFLKIGGQHFKFWVRNSSGQISDEMYPAYVSSTDNLSFWGPMNLFHYELQNEKSLLDTNGNGVSEDLDVSVLTSNLSADYNITVTYKLTQEAFLEWQLDAFNKIMSAYQRKLSEYEEWVNAQKIGAGITIEGNNPGINREIEKTELKKHCLSIFTGERLEWFNAMKSQQASFEYPEIDLKALPKQAAYIQFFEQAFEWANVTYRFYPYFWGRKAGWIVNSLMQDTDPIFTKFLQAGAARVVVPVRPGYEKAIATYMKTGKIWDGKPIPAPGTELFVSIVTEQQEDAGAGEFTYTGDEWELKVPTNLVYLQPMKPDNDPNSPNYNPVQFPINFV